MGQYCSDEKECCAAKRDAGNFDLSKVTRSTAEDLGSCSRSDVDEESLLVDADLSPRSKASSSYFDYDTAELELLKSRGGVKNMKPHRFESGGIYKGQWHNNMRHGIGCQSWPDGSSYTGQWQNNCAAGKGRFSHSTGDVYIGEWRNSMADGHGVFFRSGIRAYQGECRADLQEGYGAEIKVDGSRYEGTFRGGRKDGAGSYYWADGSEYHGTWRDNAVTGSGIYTASRWSYKGQWKDSLRHGLGEYNMSEGRVYAGGFGADQQNGLGVFLWPDGVTYEGFWLNGRESGHGRSISKKDGVKSVSEWFNGQLVKTVESGQSKSVDEAKSGFAAPKKYNSEESKSSKSESRQSGRISVNSVRSDSGRNRA